MLIILSIIYFHIENKTNIRLVILLSILIIKVTKDYVIIFTDGNIVNESNIQNSNDNKIKRNDVNYNLEFIESTVHGYLGENVLPIIQKDDNLSLELDEKQDLVSLYKNVKEILYYLKEDRDLVSHRLTF